MLVFIPKCRRKTLYAQLRRYVGEVFRKLAEQKESKIEEGHLMPDHVHMMISIPPKYAVSQVIGFIKGKSAIHLARTYGENRRNFVGQSFWARGYFVSTVGRDKEVIRNYIRNQEEEDQRLEQMNLFGGASARPRIKTAGAPAPRSTSCGGVQCRLGGSGVQSRPRAPEAANITRGNGCYRVSYSESSQTRRFGLVICSRGTTEHERAPRRRSARQLLPSRAALPVGVPLAVHGPTPRSPATTRLARRLPCCRAAKAPTEPAARPRPPAALAVLLPAPCAAPHSASIAASYRPMPELPHHPRTRIAPLGLCRSPRHCAAATRRSVRD
jgi:putative transposase